MKNNRRQWISEDTPILLGVIGACGFCLAILFEALLILFVPNLRINPDFYFLSAAFFLVTTTLLVIILDQREKIKRIIIHATKRFLSIITNLVFVFNVAPPARDLRKSETKRK